MIEHCDVCDSAGHVGACTGFPGAIYAPHSRNWFTVSEAISLETAGFRVEWHTVWSYSRFGLTPPPERIVVIDSETTGLDPDLHQMVEISWHDMANPRTDTFRLSHTLENALPEALEVNRYYERGLGDARWWLPEFVDMGAVMRGLTEGAYICGSNVGFDKGFIEERWGQMPWRHTPYEIGTAVMKHVGAKVPLRLQQIPQALGLPMVQDHTARGDVEIVVAALRKMEGS